MRGSTQKLWSSMANSILLCCSTACSHSPPMNRLSIWSPKCNPDSWSKYLVPPNCSCSRMRALLSSLLTKIVSSSSVKSHAHHLFPMPFWFAIIESSCPGLHWLKTPQDAEADAEAELSWEAPRSPAAFGSVGHWIMERFGPFQGTHNAVQTERALPHRERAGVLLTRISWAVVQLLWW